MSKCTGKNRTTGIGKIVRAEVSTAGKLQRQGRAATYEQIIAPLEIGQSITACKGTDRHMAWIRGIYGGGVLVDYFKGSRSEFINAADLRTGEVRIESEVVR